MKLFIHCFLISSFSIIIINGIFPLPTESQMESIIKGNQTAITGLPEIIQLSEGGLISREQYTIFWKGTYNVTTDVAIKITTLDDSFHTELAAYEKLNATNDDFDFEKYRIPRVYHNGTIFGDNNVIVMTLCYESLEKRFELQGGNFSDSTLLLLFTQLAGTLEYLHSMKVLHNAIEPKNILFRGPNAFVVNFKSSYLQNKPYFDYDSMLEMIWKLAGANEYELDSPKFCNGKYIKDKKVYKAFEFILEIKSLYSVDHISFVIPDFENIIKAANKALADIGKKSGVQFDWLKEDSQDYEKGSKLLNYFHNRFKRDSSGASSSHKKNSK